MNKRWSLIILLISFSLLGSLKDHETSLLRPFFRATKGFIPENFRENSKKLKGKELEALGLWESLLFGKSKHVKKETSEAYKSLGLLHLFTPSGFHLSAFLVPLFYFLKSKKQKLFTLLAIGISFSFLPGLNALKRMTIIKIQQNLWGQRIGFVLGLLIDVLFGSFQDSPLSFSYSFLFLGFIYGGIKGIGLIVWFYLGQVIIVYFQGGVISPLLLLLSPFMNFSFSLLLPILLLLSFPLATFQLGIGVFLIKKVQTLIDLCYRIVVSAPSFEVTGLLLLFLLLFMMRRFRWALIVFCFISMNLNSDYGRRPAWNTNEFVPHGRITKRVYSEKKVVIYFEDGICNLKLVRGFWWENCSPERGSSRSFN